MNHSETKIEQPSSPQSINAESPENQNPYGAPLPPFDPEAAIALLESLAEEDPEEQRETLEHLQRALNEERAAGGERPVFL